MMVSNRQLIRIERESGLRFGVLWSCVGSIIALLLLSGCSLFDSGAVRYNTVTGDRRAPVLNPGGAGYASTEMAKQQMVQSYALPAAMPAPMNAQAAAAYHGAQQPYPQLQPQAAMPSQAMVGADGYPALPPTQGGQQQPWQGDAAIQADINALERDINHSQAQRSQMAVQQQQDGWMPNLGIGEWFGGSAAPAPQAMAGAPTSVAPVQLPIPPAQGSAPVNRLDVPLALAVQSSSAAHVPSSLIPPGAEAEGYLDESRYAGRRGAGQSRPF